MINRIDAVTAIPTTNRDAFYAVPVEVPEMPFQDKSALIVSAYDDSLKTTAGGFSCWSRPTRLLCKEWFVQLRFPGHKHLKIKDGVPEGWEKVRLDAIAEITMGQSPESKYYNKDGVGLPFHQGSRISVCDFLNIKHPVLWRVESQSRAIFYSVSALQSGQSI